MTRKFHLFFVSILSYFATSQCTAFVATRHLSRKAIAEPTLTLLSAGRRRTGDSSDDGQHFLLEDYVMADTGEVLDPYQVLKVSRTASASVIRDSYLQLSKKYHPNARARLEHSRRQRDSNSRFQDPIILPGKCNNEQDIANEWEKIRLSYEILRHGKSRKRYDRHVALADPGAAIRRAMVDATLSSLSSVGQGLWSVGSSLTQHVWNEVTTKKMTDEQQKESPVEEQAKPTTATSTLETNTLRP